MTTKEYMDVLAKGMKKAHVARDFQDSAWQTLGWYFNPVKDDDGNPVYKDGNYVLDFNSPQTSWDTVDGDSELAKELHEVVSKAIEKWMVTLDK